MGKNEVPMDVRMAIAVAPDDVNISAFCRQHGISRPTFYAWKERFKAEGPDGLTMRSRAPKTTPGQVCAEVEDAIVAMRKELTDLGVDAGSLTIEWHLIERGEVTVPSLSTIWRVLVRRGFVTPEPKKRPKAAWRRFEASAPNEMWQADVFEWEIGVGLVKVISFVDDHSRVALRSKAVLEATTVATWETFCEATERWGVPFSQLSDNGLNFSGKLKGFEVGFERELREIGVVTKTSRPFHPQTCGKVERFQQTLKKWLANQPVAETLEEFQAQLDWFVNYYNHERPHQGIGRKIPAQRWAATPPAINLGVALPSPARTIKATVTANGVVNADKYQIAVGSEWKHHKALVRIDGLIAAVFIGHDLVRVLTLDPTRRYQPTGRPRGRRPLT